MHAVHCDTLKWRLLPSSLLLRNCIRRSSLPVLIARGDQDGRRTGQKKVGGCSEGGEERSLGVTGSGIRWGENGMNGGMRVDSDIHPEVRSYQ